jgi:hypothetical protein
MDAFATRATARRVLLLVRRPDDSRVMYAEYFRAVMTIDPSSESPY